MFWVHVLPPQSTRPLYTLAKYPAHGPACFSLSLCLSPSIPLGSPPPHSPLFPSRFPPGALGGGETGELGCTYKPVPLFDNLFLSSSCWQAAGEEQKVNETLCSGITDGGRRAGEPAMVTGN